MDFQPGKLWSLLDMLESYFPIYQLALDLEALRTSQLNPQEANSTKLDDGRKRFRSLSLPRNR
jgi:hypothetical protein